MSFCKLHVYYVVSNNSIEQYLLLLCGEEGIVYNDLMLFELSLY